MSIYCGNCGAQMDDNAIMCGNCGAKLNQTPQMYGNTSINPASVTTGMQYKSNSKNTKIIIAGVVAVVVIIAAIVGVILLSGSGSKKSSGGDRESSSGSYKSAISTLVKAIEKGKADGLESLIPGKLTRDEKEELIEEIEDDIIDMNESVQDYVGDNLKISYEIIDDEKLSGSELEDFLEEIEDNSGFELGKITEVRDVDIELIAKGSDDEDEDTLNLTLIKEDGKWKIWFE